MAQEPGGEFGFQARPQAGALGSAQFFGVRQSFQGVARREHHGSGHHRAGQAAASGFVNSGLPHDSKR